MVAGPAEARRAHERFEPTIGAVFFARDLVSEPANVLYPANSPAAPASYQARRQGRDPGEAEMKKLGMNALLGVGQGSPRESQLVVMRWMNGPKAQKPVALRSARASASTPAASR